MTCVEILKKDVFWVAVCPNKPELLSTLLPKIPVVSTEDNGAPKREDFVEAVDVDKVALEL